MAVGVIPARYAAKRLEGKPLRVLGGKPIIEWVYRQAEQARTLTDLIVATDDERICAAVKAFDGKVVLTSKSHASGTDRVAEIAATEEWSIVVNIQVDTPFLPPTSIDAVVEALERDETSQMASIRSPIEQIEEWRDPNTVKVVCDAHDNALYFSRSPIPYGQKGTNGPFGFKHIGVYAFRRDYLLQFAASPASRLEKREQLEQLRALEDGARVKMVIERASIFDIDTPEDLDRAQELVNNGVYRFPERSSEGLN